MRHVISVDGTFMKSKFQGTLLVATCQDANLQIYPLAFGIVDSENVASWTWFFNKLFQVTGMLEGLVFISDRKDIIGNAIKIVYLYAHHECCMWHLQLNIKSNYHKTDNLPLFMATAKEYSLINFEKSMANLYCKSTAVGQYMEKKVGYEFWSRAHFKGIRYNIMTTNNAKSLNLLFKNAQEFPILDMVEQIRKTLQKWFYERHIEAKKCATTLTLSIEDKICKKYDDAKLPCKHALPAMKFKGISCYSLCSPYYTSASWKQAYAESSLFVQTKTAFGRFKCMGVISTHFLFIFVHSGKKTAAQLVRTKSD
ncbi:uncharacterized protein LOC111397885 [Olea europaea var. sylvestris]|uniref:uncharacterized protein LOC111397885 n=1 Tax=Olea europaea var. sylvestris TaxID=158386 RepID=UPI000C1D7415|nr:uncharacterized protein LOC111397885 [Olea europaea var. sylvestris]